jgi:hypothetical protein
MVTLPRGGPGGNPWEGVKYKIIKIFRKVQEK